jgi:O-antigen biosynthesis protein
VKNEIRRSWGVLRREGVQGFVRKGSLQLARRASDRFAWSDLQFPLLAEDVFDSASVVRGNRETHRPTRDGDRLRVGFVCVPPSAGSGGHTTLFRMINSVQSRGHDCTLFLYDQGDEDVQRHRAVLNRSWPWLRASVRSARPRIDDVDVVVASSWDSAHVIANRADPVIPRYYFVQDYEPYFYPRGPLWALAEDTYRFGFKIIALGEMVSSCLQDHVGVMPHATVPFGCDTDTYRLLDQSGSGPDRTGIVLYAKTTADRRGYWLARRALHLFHHDHPEQPIHVVGDHVTGWTIPVIQHGSVPPRELNVLYNQAIAGLALSFTNISLAAEEMLAAGAVAVVNDSPLARLDLPTGHAVWAPATPAGLAAALSATVEAPDHRSRALAAAAAVRHGWDETGSRLAAVIEDDVRGLLPGPVAGHAAEWSQR